LINLVVKIHCGLQKPIFTTDASTKNQQGNPGIMRIIKYMLIPIYQNHGLKA